MSQTWLLQLRFDLSQPQGGTVGPGILWGWGCAAPECLYSPSGQEGWSGGVPSGANILSTPMPETSDLLAPSPINIFHSEKYQYFTQEILLVQDSGLCLICVSWCMSLSCGQ